MRFIDMTAAASREPREVRDSRRRAAALLKYLRVKRQQLERELLELGYLDLGGEAGGE